MLLRIIRFGFVGVLCLLVQLLFLAVLKYHMDLLVANAISFLLSAQANFMLSYGFTWRDSQRHSGRLLAITWVKFNSVVISAACINTVAFGVLRYTLVQIDEVAAIFAVAISTIFTFCINHFIVLKPVGVEHGSTSRDSNVPAGME